MGSKKRRNKDKYKELVDYLNKDDSFTKEVLKNLPKGAVVLPTITNGEKQISFFIKDSKDFLEKVSNPFFQISGSTGKVFVGEKKVIVGVLYIEIFALDGQPTTYEMFLNIFYETNSLIYKRLSMQEKLYFVLLSEDCERVGNGFTAKSPAFIKEFIDKLFLEAETVEKWTFNDFTSAKEIYLKNVSMEELREKSRLVREMN